MTSSYTARNRRPPELRAGAECQDRSWFALSEISPRPGTPAAPPQPFGDLSRARIDELAKLARDEVGA